MNISTRLGIVFTGGRGGVLAWSFLPNLGYNERGNEVTVRVPIV